jgi:hypothetical protein
MAASATNPMADPSMTFVGSDNDEAQPAVVLKRQD